MSLLGKKDVIVPEPPKLDGKATGAKPENVQLTVAEMEALHAKGTHRLEVVEGKVSLVERKPEKQVTLLFLKQGALNGVPHERGQVKAVPESHVDHYLACGAATRELPKPVKLVPAPSTIVRAGDR